MDTKEPSVSSKKEEESTSNQLSTVTPVKVKSQRNVSATPLSPLSSSGITPVKMNTHASVSTLPLSSSGSPSSTPLKMNTPNIMSTTPLKKKSSLDSLKSNIDQFTAQVDTARCIVLLVSWRPPRCKEHITFYAPCC